MAAVVLAVIAIGAASLIFHCRSRVMIQGNRRAALEIAAARLEELIRESDYGELEAMIGVPMTDTVTINGQPGFQVTTSVSDGGAAADNCLLVHVDVEYRRATGDTVSLETLRGE